VAVPPAFVNTASYSYPLSNSVEVTPYELDVAPLIADHEPPSLEETLHCTLGLGLPDALAVKVAVVPDNTTWLVGDNVTTGADVALHCAYKVMFEPNPYVAPFE
jgi:hypothetical protein